MRLYSGLFPRYHNYDYYIKTWTSKSELIKIIDLWCGANYPSLHGLNWTESKCLLTGYSMTLTFFIYIFTNKSCTSKVRWFIICFYFVQRLVNQIVSPFLSDAVLDVSVLCQQISVLLIHFWWEMEHLHLGRFHLFALGKVHCVSLALTSINTSFNTVLSFIFIDTRPFRAQGSVSFPWKDILLKKIPHL